MKTPKQFEEAFVRCSKSLGVECTDLEFNDFTSWLVKDLKKSNNSKVFNSVIHNVSVLGGFKKLKQSLFGVKLDPYAELVKSKVRVNNKSAKRDAAEAVFNDKFEEACGRFLKNKIVIPDFKFNKNSNIKRNNHLLISDTHFGAILREEEGLVKFGRVEASRRLAKVVAEAIDYKIQYRDNTKLIVNLNGDIIQGKLHDPMDGEEVADQVCMAIHLLAQGLASLAANYPEVEVNCATGNHDRDLARHEDRAIVSKWASEATKIYFALKMALAHVPNIKIKLTKKPYIAYESFGIHYYGTHGDNMIKVGNPGSSLNVKALQNEINALNASLKDKNEYKVVFLGHVHVGVMLKMNNGVTLITNPPLVPPDYFAKSIGVHEAPTGQWLWESVPGHPVGDSRYLEVDQNTDKDVYLDKIIKPYTGFSD